MANQDDNLALSVWVKRGIMMVRRSALDVDDPESWPSKWQEKFGDLDGFPWREVYDDGAEDARRAWALKMKRRHGELVHCPNCGYQLY